MESANKKIESYFHKLIHLLIAFPLLLQACWAFESNIKEKDVLYDNFKIIEDQNDEKAGIMLVLNHDEVYYNTVEERCKEIYFDSANIYVKSAKTDFDTTSVYSHVKILSFSTGDKDAVFQKRELDISEFNKSVKRCVRCTKRTYIEENR
jgi:hypothetical protein